MPQEPKRQTLLKEETFPNLSFADFLLDGFLYLYSALANLVPEFFVGVAHAESGAQTYNGEALLKLMNAFCIIST